jgi:hypothetical protein
MPDWKPHIREHLRLPELSEDQKEKILSELAGQMEELYRSALDGGASESDALKEAKERMGDWEDLSEKLSHLERPSKFAAAERRVEDLELELRRKGRWGTILADGWQDLRLTLREMQRRPLLSALAIITLGLGIGATTAMFSVVDAVLLRKLPYPDPDRLVKIHTYHQGQAQENSSEANLFDYRDQIRSLVSCPINEFK